MKSFYVVSWFCFFSNKVALKPGHSLMDWIRFSKSGKDLTGFRGRLIEVTQEELQKHNKRDDCWTCIRGESGRDRDR